MEEWGNLIGRIESYHVPVALVCFSNEGVAPSRVFQQRLTSTKLARIATAVGAERDQMLTARALLRRVRLSTGTGIVNLITIIVVPAPFLSHEVLCR